QHPRRQRGRLLDLPRPHRPDVPHLAGADAADGAVHQLPPQPGSVRATEGSVLQHAVAAPGRPAGPRRRAGEGIQDPAGAEPDELFDLPPLSGPVDLRSDFQHGFQDASQERTMSQGTEDKTQRGAADEDCHVEWKKAPAPGASLDLATVRERLRDAKGPQFWRSLEELAATPQFEDMLQREFPRHAAEWPAESDDPTRN